MRKNQTTWIWVVIIIAAIILISAVGNKNSKQNDALTVGAILPMSGPSAIFGEELKFGMEYALSELDPEHSITLKVEDSEAKAQAGISAFNKLLSQDTDLFISALSRVSIPIKDIAKKNNKPLIITLAAALDIVDKNDPSIIRVFNNTESIADAHVKTITKKGFKRVGIIALNDEYGVSVTESLKQRLSALQISVVSESFSPEQTDYRTQIQKIKAANVDVMMFVTIPPTSLQTFIKQADELHIDIPLVDVAGILPAAGALKMIGNASEGIYTFATPFDLSEDTTGIYAKLDELGMERAYPIAYGYDAMKYIIQVKEIADEENISIKDALPRVKVMNGLQGAYDIQIPEVQPILIPVQVIGGKFVEVK